MPLSLSTCSAEATATTSMPLCCRLRSRRCCQGSLGKACCAGDARVLAGLPEAASRRLGGPLRASPHAGLCAPEQAQGANYVQAMDIFLKCKTHIAFIASLNSVLELCQWQRNVANNASASTGHSGGWIEVVVLVVF